MTAGNSAVIQEVPRIYVRPELLVWDGLFFRVKLKPCNLNQKRAVRACTKTDIFDSDYRAKPAIEKKRSGIEMHGFGKRLEDVSNREEIRYEYIKYLS